MLVRVFVGMRVLLWFNRKCAQLCVGSLSDTESAFRCVLVGCQGKFSVKVRVKACFQACAISFLLLCYTTAAVSAVLTSLFVANGSFLTLSNAYCQSLEMITI